MSCTLAIHACKCCPTMTITLSRGVSPSTNSLQRSTPSQKKPKLIVDSRQKFTRHLLLYRFYDLCVEWLVPTAVKKESELVDLKKVTKRPFIIRSRQNWQLDNRSHPYWTSALQRLRESWSTRGRCTRQHYASAILLFSHKSLQVGNLLIAFWEILPWREGKLS